MLAEDRSNAGMHDQITRRCMLCGQEKPVPPGTDDYRRAHAGEQFPFTCPACEEQTREELDVAGGTVDDPLDTP